MEKFIEVCLLDLATHWQPEEKKLTEDITIGKMYKLETSKMDGEKCIHDDVGVDSMSYMWNRGKLFLEIEEQEG
jgi:hypothetical protein